MKSKTDIRTLSEKELNARLVRDLYISVKTLEVHLGHAVQKIREALRKKNIC